jgi:hypothetical protein
LTPIQLESTVSDGRPSFEAGERTLRAHSQDGLGSRAGLAGVHPMRTRRPNRTNVFLNLSSRARIAPGQDTLIAGLVVERPSNVLIRGIGPGLLPFQISQPLAQPVLTLFDQAGKVIAQNSDWRLAIPGSNPESPPTIVTEVMARVGAFAPATGDAALYLRLAPGLYTAQLAGANWIQRRGID